MKYLPLSGAMIAVFYGSAVIVTRLQARVAHIVPGFPVHADDHLEMVFRLADLVRFVSAQSQRADT